MIESLARARLEDLHDIHVDRAHLGVQPSALEVADGRIEHLAGMAGASRDDRYSQNGEPPLLLGLDLSHGDGKLVL